MDADCRLIEPAPKWFISG